MINNLEKVIAAFGDSEHRDRIAEGLRYFSEHPDQQGDSFADAMTRQFGVPVLLQHIGQGWHPTVPLEVIVDELIDFASLYFTQNVTQNGENMSISFTNIEPLEGWQSPRAVTAHVVGSFANQFRAYIDEVFVI